MSTMCQGLSASEYSMLGVGRVMCCGLFILFVSLTSGWLFRFQQQITLIESMIDLSQRAIIVERFLSSHLSQSGWLRCHKKMLPMPLQIHPVAIVRHDVQARSSVIVSKECDAENPGVLRSAYYYLAPGNAAKDHHSLQPLLSLYRHLAGGVRQEIVSGVEKMQVTSLDGVFIHGGVGIMKNTLMARNNIELRFKICASSARYVCRWWSVFINLRLQ
jgi:hypothetical protein